MDVCFMFVSVGYTNLLGEESRCTIDENIPPLAARDENGWYEGLIENFELRKKSFLI